MSIYAYVYRYGVEGIQGKGMSVNGYLSLAAIPGIYFVYNGIWSVLEVNDYGSFNTLHKLEVPNEVKIHHLLTN